MVGVVGMIGSSSSSSSNSSSISSSSSIQGFQSFGPVQDSVPLTSPDQPVQGLGVVVGIGR